MRIKSLPPLLLLPPLMALVVAATLGPASPAAGDCVGPTISYVPAEVDVGDVIVVEGYGWGDNCYDTGPPPAGEGDLGNPLTDIDIVVVTDDDVILVASGNADGRYEFTAEIVVPGALGSGDFTIETRPESYVETPQPMILTDGAGTTGGNPEPGVVSFGPAERAIPEQARQNADGAAPGDASSGGVQASAIVMAVGFVIILMATGAVVATRRR